LSEADLIRAGVLDPERCVQVCSDVFELLARGDYLMGGQSGNSHGMGLAFPDSSPFPGMPLAGPDRRFVTMPAYVGGRFDVCGNKWYGSNPTNRDRGLPRSVLTLMLNDKETGEPIGLLSANLLSAARTGAIPALASRHLAQGSKRLAVIGCGVIGKSALSALITQQPGLEAVGFFDVSPSAAQELAVWTAEEFGLQTVVAPTAEDCVSGADLVSVAASRAVPLVIDDYAFAPGATILLSGPMNSSQAFWTNSRIVLDHVGLHQDYHQEAGRSASRTDHYKTLIGGPVYELVDEGRLPPLHSMTDLAQIVAGQGNSVEEASPADKYARTVFLACGMAVFDVGLGFDLLVSAREQALGTPLSLWN
jgi:ornithine cyclodeaminase